MKNKIVCLLGAFVLVPLQAVERVVPTSQGTINVWDSQGDGPAVMLIHGNSASGNIFKKQFESILGKKYRLIAPDLQGHGKSALAKDTSTYSFPGYAKVLAEVVHNLGLKEISLIGWSLGGHIALEMVVLPLPIRGVLITGTPPIQLTPEGIGKGFRPFEGLGLLGHPHPFTREEAITFMGLGGIDMSSSDVAFIIEDAMKADGTARSCMFASIGNGIGSDETAIVRTMHIPLAIVAGENDAGINTEYIAKEVSYSTLWRGQVQMIKDAGHAVFWENADAFNHIVLEFLESLHSV